MSPAPSRPEALTAAVWAEAPRHLVHLAGRDGNGLFLPNGGRLRLDPDGMLATETPECRSPSTALLYLRAAEQTILDLARRVGNEAGRPVGLSRLSDRTEEVILLDQPGDEWVSAILPFLVSRVVIAGPGALDASTGGLSFVLSKRPSQAKNRISEVVASERPPRLRLPTRAEPGSRLRIRIGDASGSDAAGMLAIGATMLVVDLATRGRIDPARVALRRPLAAWRAFAADPSYRVTAPLVGGGVRTAVAIQREYLDAVTGSAELPGWAGELSTRWREALDQLGADQPPSWLEWPERLRRFEEAIRSEPSWRDLGRWNERWGDAASSTDPGALAYRRVRRSLAALESSLDQVDLEGPRARFTAAQRRNAADSGPPDTRAAVRAKWIRRLGATEQRSRFRADWHGVWDLVAGSWIDLSDPNVTHQDWCPAGTVTGQRDLFAGFRDWLEEL